MMKLLSGLPQLIGATLLFACTQGAAGEHEDLRTISVTTPAAFLLAQNTSEESRCEKCWLVYEGTIRMCSNFAALASERDNGTAGGATASEWNAKVQNALDKIRECCTDDEIGERCNRFEGEPAQQVCLDRNRKWPPTPDEDRDPKDNADTEPNGGEPEPENQPPRDAPAPDPVEGKTEPGQSSSPEEKPLVNTKPCNPRLPNWIEGWLRALGFCGAAAPNRLSERCRLIKDLCIVDCEPELGWGNFDRCKANCMWRNGC